MLLTRRSSWPDVWMDCLYVKGVARSCEDAECVRWVMKRRYAQQADEMFEMVLIAVVWCCASMRVESTGCKCEVPEYLSLL